MVSTTDSVAAYAVYFDYKRRNDPEFRKTLKKESRRQARIQKEEAEVQGKKQKEEIKAAVREAIEEGFPTDLEEREAFFMQQIAQGEQLAAEGEVNAHFYSHALTRCRLRSHRRRSLLLQGSQGLSRAYFPHQHLRQHRLQRRPRNPRGHGFSRQELEGWRLWCRQGGPLRQPCRVSKCFFLYEQTASTDLSPPVRMCIKSADGR